MNNKFAIEAVNHLIQADKLPDFCMYICRTWTRSFIKGPSEFEGVKKVDQQLQSLLQSFGSPEKRSKRLYSSSPGTAA